MDERSKGHDFCDTSGGEDKTLTRARHLMVALTISVLLNILLLVLWLWNVQPGGALRPVQLGDLGTWIGGIGSALAVIIAVLALRESSQSTDAERLKGISSWLYHVDRHEVITIPGLPDGFSGLYLALQNETPNPIFDIRIDLARANTQLATFNESVWPPGKTLARAMPLTNNYWYGLDPAEVPKQVSIKMEFTDASGQRWISALKHGWRKL